MNPVNKAWRTKFSLKILLKVSLNGHEIGEMITGIAVSYVRRCHCNPVSALLMMPQLMKQYNSAQPSRDEGDIRL